MLNCHSPAHVGMPQLGVFAHALGLSRRIAPLHAHASGVRKSAAWVRACCNMAQCGRVAFWHARQVPWRACSGACRNPSWPRPTSAQPREGAAFFLHLRASLRSRLGAQAGPVQTTYAPRTTALTCRRLEGPGHAPPLAAWCSLVQVLQGLRFGTPTSLPQALPTLCADTSAPLRRNLSLHSAA